MWHSFLLLLLWLKNLARLGHRPGHLLQRAFLEVQGLLRQLHERLFQVTCLPFYLNGACFCPEPGEVVLHGLGLLQALRDILLPGGQVFPLLRPILLHQSQIGAWMRRALRFRRRMLLTIPRPLATDEAFHAWPRLSTLLFLDGRALQHGCKCSMAEYRAQRKVRYAFSSSRI